MSMGSIEAGLVLLGLGAVHGLNPGMGWLFAVSLGIQRESGGAVWRALPPLAAGHALAVAAAVVVAGVLGMAIPPEAVRWVIGLSLIGLGVVLLVRHAHPTRGGMRVGAKELVAWSFLVSTAHGAGLMALPFALEASAGGAVPTAGVGDGPHMHHGMATIAGAISWDTPALWPTVVHTLGYLLTTGVLAVVVYEKLGLGMLRWAWVNVNTMWAGALVLTGVATLLL